MFTQVLTIMLFLLCSPIAKWEADSGWEYNDGNVTIDPIYQDGGIIEFTWKSDTPICQIDVKAATDVTTFTYDPPMFDGGLSWQGEPHDISHIVWYSQPSAISVVGIGVTRVSDVYWVMMLLIPAAILTVYVLIRLIRTNKQLRRDMIKERGDYDDRIQYLADMMEGDDG